MTGTPADAMGLGFLLRIMELLFGEAVKDRLRPRSPTEIAKERAFYLYELLEQISGLTDLFVVQLRLYINALKMSATLPRSAASREHRDWILEAAVPSLSEFRENLWRVARDLGAAVGALPEGLEAVNPQLKIHRNDLVRGIEGYRRTRTGIITDLGDAVAGFLEHGIWGDADESRREITTLIPELEELLDSAQANQALIKRILEEMRTFLAAEFAFKESF
jgi:hypothetical protein